jgi:hypothetical protein
MTARAGMNGAPCSLPVWCMAGLGTGVTQTCIMPSIDCVSLRRHAPERGDEKVQKYGALTRRPAALKIVAEGLSDEQWAKTCKSVAKTLREDWEH